MSFEFDNLTEAEVKQLTVTLSPYFLKEEQKALLSMVNRSLDFVEDRVGALPSSLVSMGSVTTGADNILYTTSPGVFSNTYLSPLMRSVLAQTTQFDIRNAIGASPVLANTDSLAEGVANLYYTDVRVDALAVARKWIQNPTTTTGDLIYRDSGGNTTRLPIGLTGDVLSVVGGIPTWQAAMGGGVVDGDKGDVVVTGGGLSWNLDSGVVTNTKLAAAPTLTLKGNNTGSAASPADLTVSQVKTMLAYTAGDVGADASGAATAAQAFAIQRSNHTGTQVASTISDFSTAVAATAAVTANTAKVTNATHTGDATGATALTIANDVVTNAKLANMAANSFKINNTGSAADPIDGTVAQVKTLLAYTPADIGAATSAQANATHTGDATGATALTLATVNSNVGAFGSATQIPTFTVNAKGLTTAAANVAISIPSSQVSDFSEAVDDRVSALAVAGTNMTITYNDVANTLTFDAAGGGAGTDLSYTAATRVIASSTGVDATLPLVSTGDAGLAPASGGGTANFLRADGAWAAPSGGGGGSPGGSSGEVQYNNAGAFDGAADVEIEGGQLRLRVPATAPSTPAADGIKLYAKNFGGRLMPGVKGPSGQATVLQPHIGRNSISYAQPILGGATPSAVGIVLTATGTAAVASWASTSLHTKLPRSNYQVTVAATTAVAGWRYASVRFTIGNNNSTDGAGGFHYVCMWGPSTGVSTTTNRAFVGMANTTGAPTDVEPSSITNIVGMGWDAADTNIQIMHRGTGAVTKIDLGASFPVPTANNTEVYELSMFSPANTTTQTVGYRVQNMATGDIAEGTITTNLPTTTTALAPRGWMSVGGTSSVIGIALMKLYVETDL